MVAGGRLAVVDGIGAAADSMLTDVAIKLPGKKINKIPMFNHIILFE